MKRDMDLVRHILLEVESADDDVQLQELTCGDWTLEMVGYHVELMCNHDLVDGVVHRTGSGRVGGGFVRALTWDGCDYLDAIRDDGVWAKTKKLVREAVGSTTMAVIKDAACMVATQAIRARLGIQ